MALIPVGEKPQDEVYATVASVAGSGSTTYESQLADAGLQAAYAALSDDEKKRSVVDVGIILRYTSTGVYTAVTLNGGKTAGVFHVLDVPNKTFYQVTLPNAGTISVDNRSANPHSSAITLNVLKEP